MEEIILKVLNEALESDRLAIETLFRIKTFCNLEIAKHPFIQVGGGYTDNYYISLIGLINGFFQNEKLIAADYDNATGHILKFALVNRKDVNG
jgi:hypothetical protein